MQWQYRKRSDGIIAITLDNNVWDFLFQRKLDLASELPSDQFAIIIPREVEIETFAIPANDSKIALKELYCPDDRQLRNQDNISVWVCQERPRPTTSRGFWAGDVPVSDRTRILRGDKWAIPLWETRNEKPAYEKRGRCRCRGSILFLDSTDMRTSKHIWPSAFCRRAWRQDPLLEGLRSKWTVVEGVYYGLLSADMIIAWSL